MKKLLIFSVIVLFIGLGFNHSYLESNAQTTPLVAPTPCDGLNVPCPNPIPQVISVVFEPVNSPIDGNPNLENGRRIFPDKDNPTDATNRKIVKVTATLSGTTEQTTVKVIFKTFDVDDPSPSMIIDPNGDSGNDNKGSPKAGTLSADLTTEGTENNVAVGPDTNGIAVAYLTVTMQPGDNFVVAAIVNDTDYLDSVSVNGTGLKHPVDGVLPTARAKRTDMLTVWRRLHIEVDSMGAVTGNKVEGTLTETKKIGTGNQPLNLSVNNLEVNRFENGRLLIKRNGSLIANLPIIAASVTVNANTTNSVTVFNNTSVFSVNSGDLFTLYDDDNLNGNNNGDEGYNINLNSQPIVSSAFEFAYILPEYQWATTAGYNQNNINFGINRTQNTADLDTFLESIRNSNDKESDNFWVSHILYAYQPFITNDGDPYLETSSSTGIVAATTLAVATANSITVPFPEGGDSSVIFLETCRDLDVISGQSYKILTTTHEMGHQFGLLGHSSIYGVMASQYGTPAFVPTHINMLRTRVASPGR